MFNLLPDILKDEIRSNYKKRLVIIILTFILFGQISFLIFLLPTWVVSVYREKDATSEIEAMKQRLSSEDSTQIVSVITETNTKLNIINSVMEYPEFLPITDTIIANKISAIKINEISYVSTGPTSATINLKGISDTRDGLVLFVKNLENSKIFKEVNLPVSNFAKDKNIIFSISMKISQQ